MPPAAALRDPSGPVEIRVTFEAPAPETVEHRLVLDAVDVELLEHGVEELRLLPLLGPLELVVAADFDYSVRRRAEDDATLKHFVSRRSRVAVAAKAISDASGMNNSIVVHAALFSKWKSMRLRRKALGIDMRRMTAHEGWHSVLQQRQEDLRAQTADLGLDDDRPDLRLASHVIEEFRVERVLCAKRDLRSEAARDDATVILEALRGLRSAPDVPSSPDPAAFLETFLGLCQENGQRLALIAAEQIECGLEVDERIRRTRTWRHGGGRHWESLVTRLRDVPSAETAIPATQRGEIRDVVAKEVKSWLEALALVRRAKSITLGY